MKKVWILAGLTALAFTAAAVLQARARSQHADKVQAKSRGPIAMILQEDEGEQMVHRAGPLKGVPFIIKVDGEVGQSEDFFVFHETLGPHVTIPFHKHENAEELLIFQEAGAEVMVGDKHGLAGAQSLVFIPRDTWISATNTSDKDIHTLAIFSRHGFESYMRAISVKPGKPLTPLSQDELTRLRSNAHAVYWDTAKGAYPPGVSHR